MANFSSESLVIMRESGPPLMTEYSRLDNMCAVVLLFIVSLQYLVQTVHPKEIHVWICITAGFTMFTPGTYVCIVRNVYPSCIISLHWSKYSSQGHTSASFKMFTTGPYFGIFVMLNPGAFFSKLYPIYSSQSYLSIVRSVHPRKYFNSEFSPDIILCLGSKHQQTNLVWKRFGKD